MRQVPHYLIIGNGRLARHFQAYFKHLQLPFSHWHRPLTVAQLHASLSVSTHILVLISDDAIPSFISDHLKGTQAQLIHCSGSLVTEQAVGAHPLMSFHSGEYALEQYKKITFVLDHDAPSFENLFPGLQNHSVRLDKSLKPKYHALCVMAGNFSCLLWQKLMNTFVNEFNLPADISHPYLEQQTKNLLEDYATALTGPLARGDMQTIEKNINALEGDSFQAVYEAFIRGHKK